MADEPPSDEDLEAIGAPRASKRLLIMAFVAGLLCALLLAAGAYYAGERDRDAPRDEAGAGRSQ